MKLLILSSVLALSFAPAMAQVAVPSTPDAELQTVHLDLVEIQSTLLKIFRLQAGTELARAEEAAAATKTPTGPYCYDDARRAYSRGAELDGKICQDVEPGVPEGPGWQTILRDVQVPVFRAEPTK